MQDWSKKRAELVLARLRRKYKTELLFEVRDVVAKELSRALEDHTEQTEKFISAHMKLGNFKNEKDAKGSLEMLLSQMRKRFKVPTRKKMTKADRRDIEAVERWQKAQRAEKHRLIEAHNHKVREFFKRSQPAVRETSQPSERLSDLLSIIKKGDLIQYPTRCEDTASHDSKKHQARVFQE